MENFKMSANDFELLAKYVTKKCAGSSVVFKQQTDSKLLVRVTTQLGESVDILIYSEDVAKFPEVVKTVKLGSEV